MILVPDELPCDHIYLCLGSLHLGAIVEVLLWLYIAGPVWLEYFMKRLVCVLSQTNFR